MLVAVQVYVPVWAAVTLSRFIMFTPVCVTLDTGCCLLPAMRGRNVQVSSGIGDPVAAQSRVILSPAFASTIALNTDTNSGARGNGDLGKTSKYPSELTLIFFVASKFSATHLYKRRKQDLWKCREIQVNYELL
jgi:hypothetical protein